MNKTLGIDLGSNSLGWAILDDITLDVIDKGVVVFPEGVDLEAGSSQETPAAERRAARMGRRMKFRRKMRKWHLLKILSEVRMCPISNEEIAEWQRHGIYPLKNRAFIEWLKSTDTSNPYCDRNAASCGKVDPMVLGRALYHLCQRRGFRSSRKEEAALVDEETGEIKSQDKATGAVKSDIAALAEEIKASGCCTLGQYFFTLLESEKGKVAKTRIRCRYTGRKEHYEEEFKVIMNAQGYAEDSELRIRLHDAIFNQRPLRSQKHLVGPCPLEKRNSRAQVGHPAFEEFRMLAFVNNLSLEDKDGNYRDEQGNFLYPLSSADRELICAEISKVKKPTFKTIRKLFKKDPRFAVQGLWFHYYNEEDAVPSCPTRQCIAAAFGEIPYDEQKVFDALTFFDDSEKLAGWFHKHFPQLGEKSVGQLLSIHPKEGNANYSLKAINRMLPFLRRGFELSHARFCAKLPDIIENYREREDEVLLAIEETLLRHRREKAERLSMAPQLKKNLPQLPTLYERYEEMLLTKFNVTADKFQKLYLRGDDVYEPETGYWPHGKRGEFVKLDKPRLPPVQLGMIRNPLVQRAMTTLRRLVNYLGEHGKLETDDTIRIELARSVNDYATRKAYQLWQKQREAIRKEAEVEIAKYGKSVTEDAIERYVLWKEQDCRCLYTGKQIQLAELLDGNVYDIEHTLPRSLSGDDALANKTICEAVYNRQIKRGMVPRDCPNWSEIDVRLRPWREHLEELEKTCANQLRKARTLTDPQARSVQRVKALVTKMERDYWRDKLRRFDMIADKLVVREGEGLGFKRRQLVDTGIMCSHAVDLMKCLYPRTYAVNGAATSFARKAWGIQTDVAKDRSEHTHHAKDAMVIAALTPARFTAICTALKDDGSVSRRECDVCPPPCDGFAEKVRTAADEILVKHVLRQTTMRQSMKRNALAHAHPQKDNPEKIVRCVLSKGDTVRGQLHEMTYYGKIFDPYRKKITTVVREKIAGMKIDQVTKLCADIVDPEIREIIKRGVEDLLDKGESNVPKEGLVMPSGVPIKRVRIRVGGARQNPMKIKEHTYCSRHEYKCSLYATSASDSNFRTAIYSLHGKLTYETENIFEWAKCRKRSDYVEPNVKEGFMGYIYPGRMVLAVEDGADISVLPQKKLSERLYYVRTLPTSKDSRMLLQHHLTAVSKKEITDKSPKICAQQHHQLIRASANILLQQMLLEGIHFRMMLDGTIKFL